MDKFKFYLPAEIIKATDPKGGSEVMKFKGVASDSGRDAQGEFLDPSGFDLTGFRWINWNHKGKDDPATIIGEPTLAKITAGNELYIEGQLYPEMPMAQSAFGLMKALANSPSGNKLSLSVEGKVIERDPKNPKRILRSRITAVAICPVPVNANTWVDLLQKGFTGEEEKKEDEFDEDTKKAMEAENSVTSKEDVEHNIKDLTKKSLRKSDIYDQIFNKYPSIDLDEAKSVYSLIEKISTMEDKAKTVSTETITKAFDILSLASEEISKAASNKEEMKKAEEAKAKEKEKDEDGEDKEMYEKAFKAAKELKKGGKDHEYTKGFLMKKGYGESMIKKAIEKADTAEEDTEKEKEADKKNAAEIGKSFEALTDLIKSQAESNDAKFQALGTIMKAQSEENADLKKSLDDTLAANIDLKKDIEKALSQPNGQKSVTVKSYSEKFQKSEDGKDIYNINSASDRKVLQTKILDLSGINKSDNDGKFDTALAKIAQDIELTRQISPAGLQRLGAVGIKVVVG